MTNCGWEQALQILFELQKIYPSVSKQMTPYPFASATRVPTHLSDRNIISGRWRALLSNEDQVPVALVVEVEVVVVEPVEHPVVPQVEVVDTEL